MDADPYLALTKQVVQHVQFLLANRGPAAGIASLLHPDFCKQRVLNFGLSRLYWAAGRASECNPAWLAEFHPEALQAEQPDAEALVVVAPASDITKQAASAARDVDCLISQQKGTHRTCKRRLADLSS